MTKAIILFLIGFIILQGFIRLMTEEAKTLCPTSSPDLVEMGIHCKGVR